MITTPWLVTLLVILTVSHARHHQSVEWLLVQLQGNLDAAATSPHCMLVFHCHVTSYHTVPHYHVPTQADHIAKTEYYNDTAMLPHLMLAFHSRISSHTVPHWYQVPTEADHVAKTENTCLYTLPCHSNTSYSITPNTLQSSPYIHMIVTHLGNIQNTSQLIDEGNTLSTHDIFVRLLHNARCSVYELYCKFTITHSSYTQSGSSIGLKQMSRSGGEEAKRLPPLKLFLFPHKQQPIAFLTLCWEFNYQ